MRTLRRYMNLPPFNPSVELQTGTFSPLTKDREHATGPAEEVFIPCESALGPRLKPRLDVFSRWFKPLANSYERRQIVRKLGQTKSINNVLFFGERHAESRTHVTNDEPAYGIGTSKRKPDGEGMGTAAELFSERLTQRTASGGAHKVLPVEQNICVRDAVRCEVRRL